MSFIIRSSNGQRSLTKITNKDQERGSVRDELIEALKGLTIKFELRVADILQADQTNESESQGSADKQQDINQTFANRAGDILTELKTKLIGEQQQQQQQQQQHQQQQQQQHHQQQQQQQQQNQEQQHVEATAATVTPTPPNQVKSEPTTIEQPQPKPVTATSSIRPTMVPSSIRPAIYKPKPAPNEPVRGPSQLKDAIFDEPAKEQEEETAPKMKAKVEIVEPKTTRFLDAGSKPPAKAPQNTGTLVKGSLKIGSNMKTCCIWIDESKQPQVPYISYDSDRLAKITSMITNMADSIEAQPPVSSIDVGDIVFAKSKDDDAWYRSIVERVGVEDVTVYIFDWGLTEVLDLSRIRRLAVMELGLSKQPATAIKVRICNPPGSLVDKFLECDSMFDIKVNSYDEFDETYDITILGASKDS